MYKGHTSHLPHPQLGTWPATQACALTGNRTGDLFVHRLGLNPLSHTSQGQEEIFKKMKCGPRQVTENLEKRSNRSTKVYTQVLAVGTLTCPRWPQDLREKYYWIATF